MKPQVFMDQTQADSTKIDQRKTLWRSTAAGQTYPSVEGQIKADVCVIGAGMTGLTAAYLLGQSGMDVVVVEASELGAGTSGSTSAHLDPLTDVRLHRLISHYGVSTAREIIESGIAAIDFIEQASLQQGVACEFQRVPAHLFTEDEKELAELDAEFEAAMKLGLAVERSSSSSIPFEFKEGIKFSIHAQFHPLKYLAGLAENFTARGGRLYFGSRVLQYNSGKRCSLETEKGKITCDHLILATHTPIGLSLSVQTRVFPYRSYVVGAKLKGTYPKGLYWDMAEPYHYLRTAYDSTGPVCLVGGEDHKTGEGHPEQSFSRLEDFVRDRLPVEDIPFRWSSQYYLSADGLPYIGPLPYAPHTFVATGYEGNGLTFGTVAGMLLSDHVLGKVNSWQPLYTPERINPLASAQRFLAENLRVAKHYVADRLAAPRLDPHQLSRGEGKLIRYQGRSCAAYRDSQGEVHLLSPICTHAKGVVKWNSSEGTWDCPCHGGRFSATGKVLLGPPTRDLDPFVPLDS